ncbi:hypothetical protein CRG98_028313, partial [Punica granatum]
MLPRKRACEGVAVEEEENKAAGASFQKKYRIGCFGATNKTGNSSIPIGNTNNNSNISSSSSSSIVSESPVMALGDSNPSEIDEDLHSRQLAVYGRETMRRLFASNVLVSGLQGLGAEIENDVGKNRALASVQKLQELNNAVVISTITTKLTKEQLSDFQAVAFTDIDLEHAIEFNDYCHSHQPPIAFIKSEVRGLFGSVFCDFGPEFTVFDVD